MALFLWDAPIIPRRGKWASRKGVSWRLVWLKHIYHGLATIAHEADECQGNAPNARPGDEADGA